jgi:solute carrier family 25 thiamine pyrophosphate transporter 19
LLTAPFDVLKIRYQVQSNSNLKYKSLFHAVRTIVNEEGFFALWKGNTSATYLWVTYAMVQFSVYSFLLKLSESISINYQNRNNNNNNNINVKKTKINNNKISTIQMFLAGAGAGIMATLATYPFDLMRTQFALQGNNKVYNNMGAYITHTISEKGPFALYSGLTPAVVGITPYMGLNFLIYETMKKINDKPIIEKDDSLNKKLPKTFKPIEKGLKNLLKKGLYGGIAGGTSKFLVYPFDTVKKRMQISSLNVLDSKLVSQYDNLWTCISTKMKQEGLSGFYRGIKPTIIKAVAASAITFATYESVKIFLHSLKEVENEHKNNSKKD